MKKRRGMPEKGFQSQAFSVAGRAIGPGHSPFIVAEISGNHGGDIERAYDLIAAAAASGADAVKFQTYEAGTITIKNDAPAFVVENELWRGRSLYDLYREAQTPFHWHERLFQKAADAGITAFSAPFDPTAVDLLESLDCPLYKIASCELVDIPLIEKVASTGKPVIMSTGMATFAEMEEAVVAARACGASDVALLHCVSGYPSSSADANLATLSELGSRFDVPVGLSDHSPGTLVPTAAVALGACIVEKHLCLQRGDGTVDSDFSLTPDEFSELVQACRETHSAIGAPIDGAIAAETDSLRFRRSLYVVEDVAAGDAFTERNVRSIRPSGGLHTRHLNEILGSRAAENIKVGTPLAWDMVDRREGS